MEDNLDVAMRENAVMKLEADYQTAYQGFDPNSVDSYIMFELMQNQYMDQSLAFASLVQTQFTQGIKRDDRGVRQAAFWVLLKSACPSVLVEMGFISNAEEEKYMGSEKGKEEITNAMFVAFSQYYSKQEGVGTVNTDSIANSLLQVQKLKRRNLQHNLLTRRKYPKRRNKNIGVCNCSQLNVKYPKEMLRSKD